MKKDLKKKITTKINVPLWALVALASTIVLMLIALVAMQSAADAHATERAFAIRESYIRMPTQNLRDIAINSILYEFSRSAGVFLLIIIIGLAGGLWNGIRLVNVNVSHEHEHHHYEQRPKKKENTWWLFRNNN